MNRLALAIGTYNISPPGNVPSGGLGSNGTNVINMGIYLLFTAGIVLGIFFIVYSGVQWVMSGGDKQKLQNARSRLIYSIVGLIVIAASFLIISTIIMLLGGNANFFIHTPATVPAPVPSP